MRDFGQGRRLTDCSLTWVQPDAAIYTVCIFLDIHKVLVNIIRKTVPSVFNQWVAYCKCYKSCFSRFTGSTGVFLGDICCWLHCTNETSIEIGTARWKPRTAMLVGVSQAQTCNAARSHNAKLITCNAFNQQDRTVLRCNLGWFKLPWSLSDINRCLTVFCSGHCFHVFRMYNLNWEWCNCCFNDFFFRQDFISPWISTSSSAICQRVSLKT